MKKIAFTCGDPAGIGFEVLLKALLQLPKPLNFYPLIFGTQALFEHEAYRSLLAELALILNNQFELRSVFNLKQVSLGQATASQGEAAAVFIKEAVQAVMNRECVSLVTAPISKEAMALAQQPFLDHTTFLKALTKVDEVSMAFYSSYFSVVLATVHVPLNKVSSLISQKNFLEKRLVHCFDFMNFLGKKHPKIAVAGLNPHAGENGLYGVEEQQVIVPFVNAAGPQVFGPFAPDTIFRSLLNKEFDCLLAMYHDQALIPLKLLAFDEAVNVTMGLPFLRTSPDHGTAYDIVGRDCANPASMKAAIQFAYQHSITI